MFSVFAEGSFSAENMQPAPAVEHFKLSGQLARRIQALLDGTPVDTGVRFGCVKLAPASPTLGPRLGARHPYRGGRPLRTGEASDAA